MPANYPKKYSDYVKEQTIDAKTVNGTIMFTDTRCHFKVEEKGKDKILAVQDDYVVLTHKNLTRSFHLSLFSLLTERQYND